MIINYLLPVVKKYPKQFAFAQLPPADDWDSIVTDGMANPQNYDVLQMIELKDTLYATFGRTGPGAAEMCRSGTGNVGDWEQVIYDSSANSGVSNDFLSTDLLIACLIEYNGFLYAGTPTEI